MSSMGTAARNWRCISSRSAWSSSPVDSSGWFVKTMQRNPASRRRWTCSPASGTSTKSSTRVGAYAVPSRTISLASTPSRSRNTAGRCVLPFTGPDYAGSLSGREGGRQVDLDELSGEPQPGDPDQGGRRHEGGGDRRFLEVLDDVRQNPFVVAHDVDHGGDDMLRPRTNGVERHQHVARDLVALREDVVRPDEMAVRIERALAR